MEKAEEQLGTIIHLLSDIWGRLDGFVGSD
jgi:hypothetical protein